MPDYVEYYPERETPKRKGPRYFEGYRFEPGINHVSEELISKLQNSVDPYLKHCLEERIIKIIAVSPKEKSPVVKTEPVKTEPVKKSSRKTKTIVEPELIE